LEKNGNSIIIPKEKLKEESMESKFYEEDKLLVFKITDEIDDCSVQKIRRRADYEIERYMPKKVVFDFDSVTFMDSAGIGMIIGRYKFANMIGAKLEVSNLTQSVKRIFEMSGILKLIPVIEERN
jgi:stage II sporulation protein AA (anti-sigma F factor antagonist)